MWHIIGIVFCILIGAWLIRVALFDHRSDNQYLPCDENDYDDTIAG